MRVREAVANGAERNRKGKKAGVEKRRKENLTPLTAG
jgi:hypothetical protein